MELAEPIQVSLKGLRSVESKLAKAYTSSLSSDEEAGRAKANKELAFLHLVRWLQLYIVGDAENVDVDLADELVNIYQSALSKSSGTDPLCSRFPMYNARLTKLPLWCSAINVCHPAIFAKAASERYADRSIQVAGRTALGNWGIKRTREDELDRDIWKVTLYSICYGD